MAKTVFGMPGIGNKKPGDATAPDKRPGATADTGPAENSGQGSQGGTSKGTTPSKSVKKGPVMAKPVSAPMAKPMSAKPSQSAKPDAGAKTMFGMPAMKLPAGGALPTAEAERRGLAATQAVPATQGARPSGAGARPSGAGVPAVEDGDARFQETVLGMAAASENIVRQSAAAILAEAGADSPASPPTQEASSALSQEAAEGMSA